MSASPSDIPSQLEAPHPEFGYLAPTKRFRRKITLTLKATVLGGLAGAAAMYFVTSDREEKPVAMLATPVTVTPAASTPTPAATVAAPAPSTPTSPVSAPSRRIRTAAPKIVAPPVPYVPQTIALPQASPRGLGLRGSVAATASGPTPSALSTVGASPAASEAAAEPVPTPVAKAVAKPKKKVVREQRPPEPEPRAAFAGPPRRPFGLPIFGFGW